MSNAVSYQNITIETVDAAILDWFDKTVDSHVDFPNGERKKVPVIFATGERAIVSRRKGVRDDNGVLIFPLLSIIRTGINPDASQQTFGTETDKLIISKRVSPKTNLIQNLQLTRTPSNRIKAAPIMEVTSIPFPDRSIFSYKMIIQTQYMTQMNLILEKIFHELDIQKSFVAPVDNNNRHPQIGVDFDDRKPLTSHFFVGFFNDNITDSGNLEEFTDQERIIRYETNFIVPVSLFLDPEGEKPSLQKNYTAYKFDLGDETITFLNDPSELELFFKIKK